MRLGLETTRALLARLGDPQQGARGALVAGTNGKGSVCAILAEIGQRAGLRVALLTKPHLTSYRERIRLDGQPIDEAFFATIADATVDAAAAMTAPDSRPTHHELLTAMGFLAARRWGADLVVCEVGLGGRLDATNVWNGQVAVLTSVALDHQVQLGNTIAKIATEKAAIVKAGNLVVSGVAGSALAPVEAATAAVSARLWQLEREIVVDSDGEPNHPIRITTPAADREGLGLGLAGRFQLDNAALAVAAADCLGEIGLPLGEAAIRSGLANVRWPGRLQTLSSEPELLLDAAHNPAAVEAVARELSMRLAHRIGVLLFGAMRDHDYPGMLQTLDRVGFESAVFTRSSSARAADPTTFQAGWSGASQVIVPLARALARARELAGAGGLVVSLGSIYLIGEVMSEMGVGVPADPEIPFPPLW